MVIVALGLVIDDQRTRALALEQPFELPQRASPVISSGVDTWIKYRERAGSEEITWEMPAARAPS